MKSKSQVVLKYSDNIKRNYSITQVIFSLPQNLWTGSEALPGSYSMVSEFLPRGTAAKV